MASSSSTAAEVASAFEPGSDWMPSATVGVFER